MHCSDHPEGLYGAECARCGVAINAPCDGRHVRRVYCSFACKAVHSITNRVKEAVEKKFFWEPTPLTPPEKLPLIVKTARFIKSKALPWAKYSLITALRDSVSFIVSTPTVAINLLKLVLAVSLIALSFAQSTARVFIGFASWSTGVAVLLIAWCLGIGAGLLKSILRFGLANTRLNLKRFVRVLALPLKSPVSTFLIIILICPVKLLEFIDIIVCYAGSGILTAVIFSCRAVRVSIDALSTYTEAFRAFISSHYSTRRIRHGLAFTVMGLSIVFLYTTLSVMSPSVGDAFAARFSQSENIVVKAPQPLTAKLVETYIEEEQSGGELVPDEYGAKPDANKNIEVEPEKQKNTIMAKKSAPAGLQNPLPLLPLITEEDIAPKEPIDLVDFSRGSTRRMEVAVTFDGGSDANHAIEILNALAQRGITTTFFLTGDFIRQYPEIVKLIVAYGHEVGNHTMTHPHLTEYAISYKQKTLPDVDKDFLQRELAGAADLFKSVTGRNMAPYWRAPYGEVNSSLAKWAYGAGYTHVGWTSDYQAKKSLDTLDWIDDVSHKYYRTGAEIKARVLDFDNLEAGLKGGIILMHLGTKRTTDTASSVLGKLLDEVIAKGYKFVKVSRLAAIDVRDMDSPGTKRLALKSTEKKLR